jgi:ABC-type proline/glycine betaine transport system permease subunit
MMAGAVPAAVLALAAQRGFGVVQRRGAPRPA